MISITLRARAKINIGLDVVRKREDGCHDLRTVMQTVRLADTIFIKRIDKPVIKLITNLKWLPTDERNLVYRAAQYMVHEYGIAGGVFIELTKSIPVCAGLGGGSADCAAALIGMRNLYGLPVSDSELAELAIGFGADVPYCVMRGTALAVNRGESLTRLRPHPHAYVLLAKPPVNVSTAAVFNRLELTDTTMHPDIDAIVRAIGDGDVPAIAGALGNTLEGVTGCKYPVIPQIKELMLKRGALGAQMSGSGPTVFGYFRDSRSMQDAAEAIAHELPQIKDIHQTCIYNPPGGHYGRPFQNKH